MKKKTSKNATRKNNMEGKNKMDGKNNNIKGKNNNIKANFGAFQKEITVKFLETLILIKLYQWKTYRYSTHIATDGLYTSLNENMDKFIEVLLGKSGERTDLMHTKSISLVDLNSSNKFKDKMQSFKKYLVDLNHNKAITMMNNSDLLNIRDEILGDVNKLLYLLSFK